MIFSTEPDTFSAAADDYAALAPVLWDPIGRASADVVAARPGDHILDACCGVGSSALPLAADVGPTGRVDAVDQAPGLIDILNRDPRRPAWLVPHIADVLTYEAGPADGLCCVLGLPFFPDPARGLRALSAMVRPGGRITVTLWQAGVMADVYAAATAARRDGRCPRHVTHPDLDRRADGMGAGGRPATRRHGEPSRTASPTIPTRPGGSLSDQGSGLSPRNSRPSNAKP